jgi:hypothetical protein
VWETLRSLSGARFVAAHNDGGWAISQQMLRNGPRWMKQCTDKMTRWEQMLQLAALDEAAHRQDDAVGADAAQRAALDEAVHRRDDAAQCRVRPVATEDFVGIEFDDEELESLLVRNFSRIERCGAREGGVVWSMNHVGVWNLPRRSFS